MDGMFDGARRFLPWGLAIGGALIAVLAFTKRKQLTVIARRVVGKNPFLEEFVRAAKTVGAPVAWAEDENLLQLIKHESGWDPEAKNPDSSATGLFQMIKSTWAQFLPEVAHGTVDPYWQAVGGLRYIRDVYKTPARAWAFWQATKERDPAIAPENLRSKAENWIAANQVGY